MKLKSKKMIYQAKPHQNETDTVILRLEKPKSWQRGSLHKNDKFRRERKKEQEREKERLKLNPP